MFPAPEIRIRSFVRLWWTKKPKWRSPISRNRNTADAEASRVLGVAAGGEGGGFFVANLNEADLLLARPQCFKNSVHAVAWEPKIISTAGAPLPPFSQVLILKGVKVTCFHTLLQVLILKNLRC